MVLAVDIGNTNIVIGIYDGNKLKTHWRLSSLSTRTSDECWIILTMLLNDGKIHVSKIKGAIISSVVPNITPAFNKMFKQHFKITPIIVNSDLDIGLKILYQNPKAVGADRIVNSIAGYHLLGGPLVVVDFGTATTFDVISKNYEYIGGIIAPGLEVTATVLHRRAARLPKVEMKFPDELIGKTTETSMQSGLMFGTVELIDGMIRRIQEELGTPIATVATGGLANLIIPHSKMISYIEPFLTLEGLRLIYEKIEKAINLKAPDR